MERVRRYPIQLRCYLGKLWQAHNRLGYPLEPLRLVLPDVDGKKTKVVLAELRGPLGSRSLLRGYELPVSADSFRPHSRMYSDPIAWEGSGGPGCSFDGYFPSPRETWWPGERLVVEFAGEPPEYASVIAAKKSG